MGSRGMLRLRRFITSYVGLVIGSLVVILVAMNALAAAQTAWLLGRPASFSLISFAPLELADYTQQLEARSIVISFENGVAGGLREAVTSLAATIPVVSQRLVDEARRDDQARASLASGSAFGLSADSARAVAAQAVAATGVVPPPLASILAPPAPTVAPSAPPTQTALPSAGAPTATGTPAAQPTQTTAAPATPTRTATPTSTPSQGGAGGGGGGGGGGTAPTATSAPAGGGQAPTQASPPPTPVPGAPTLAPTIAPVSSPTVPVVTPAASATTVPAPTATPVPPAPPPPSPTPTPEPDPNAASGPTATVTPPPTATPPEFAMDLSVPGGSSVSFQPIFSGTLAMKAGESVTRTVNIQNNGSRTFRYYLNTTGGTGILWSDTANGLQMTVKKNGANVYVGPLEMSDQLIGQLARGGQDTLQITVSLPSSSGNAFQGLSTTVSYNFTAVTVP